MENMFAPVSVTEAIENFNEILSVAQPAILVEGEVSSFKVNHSKYIFFDIKDSESSLACFMMAFALKFPLQDGMKVRILAEPQLTKWGKFSLTVREVVPIGEGSLKQSFELLKAKLQTEGLFDTARKRPLPKLPVRIGVVSSQQAAGYSDFQKILEKRWAGLTIILVHVPVQGMEAPAEIVGAIQRLNELAEPVDVIAIIRGGGSLDDLAAFNHEEVVRAIATSRTPTIVGVGHETDTTLADLAADVRAVTPTHAAELLVPDKDTIIERSDQMLRRIEQIIETEIETVAINVQQYREDITLRVENYFSHQALLISSMTRGVRQLDPQIILQRGYSVTRNQAGVIRSKNNVIIGDNITVQLSDGSIGAKVEYVD